MTTWLVTGWPPSWWGNQGDLPKVLERVNGRVRLQPASCQNPVHQVRGSSPKSHVVSGEKVKGWFETGRILYFLYKLATGAIEEALTPRFQFQLSHLITSVTVEWFSCWETRLTKFYYSSYNHSKDKPLDIVSVPVSTIHSRGKIVRSQGQGWCAFVGAYFCLVLFSRFLFTCCVWVTLASSTLGLSVSLLSKYLDPGSGHTAWF